MKISGYGITNNKYTSQTSFKQQIPKIPAQQKFVDLMKADKKMFSFWTRYYDGENFEALAGGIMPNGFPSRLINNTYHSD